MNVAQVPARDWNLYFNKVYMYYGDELVMVEPSREDGRSTLYLRPEGEIGKHIWRKADLRMLKVWWPRPGAYNYRGTAAYIARKATRCMRKSCCPRTHYYFKYGGGIEGEIIRYLKRGPNHMSWPTAKESLDSGAMISVAVCRDMIVTRVKDGYGIIYRGEPVGKIINGEYEADNDFSPTNKLVAMRLMQEGII